MCMNCGCGEPNESHGNQANIVADDLERAAKASGQDMATTVRNLQASLREASDGSMATAQDSQSPMASSGMGRAPGAAAAPGS